MKNLFNQFLPICLGIVLGLLVNVGNVHGQENDTIKATQLFLLADSLKESANYNDALSYFNKSLEIRKRAFGESHPRVADVYNGIGRTQISMGNYDLALEFFQKSLEICKSTPNSLLADTYNNMGVVYYFKGEYEQAITHYEEALKTREKVLGKMHKKVAESCGNIGLVYAVLGDFQTALDYYHQGLGILEKILKPGHLNFSYIYNKIGIIHRVKGDNELAMEFYEKALDIRRENLGELHPDVADVYINLGVIHEANGDYELSMEYTNRAIEIYESVHGEKHPYVARFYLNMGQLNFQKEQYDTALKYYDKGLKVYLENFGEQHFSVANVYNNLGTLFSAQGDYDRAAEFFEKALAIRLNVFGEKHNDVCQSYVNLGELYNLRKNNDQALLYLQKALVLRKEILGLKHPDVANVHNNLASLFLEQQDYGQALEASQQALISNHSDFASLELDQNPSSSSSLDQGILLESLQLKAQVLKKSYDRHGHLDQLKLALSTYQVCDDLIHEISQGRLLFEDKINLVKWNTDIYEETIEVCMALSQATDEEKYLRKAFTYSEKSKSGVLRQMVSTISAKSFGQIPENLLALEKEIRLERDYYRSTIQEAKSEKEGYDTIRVSEQVKTLFSLNRKYDSLVLAFEQNFPKYHQLKFDSTTVEIAALQRQLPDVNTALVEYFLADTILFTFVITKDKYEVYPKPVGKNFEALIQDFRDGLRVDGHSQKEFNKKLFTAASELYGLLFQPIASGLDKEVKKVVIIPDGLLSIIPFELLLTEKNDGNTAGYRDLSYLLKNYQISYTYSATLWSEKLLKKDKWENQFAGYAPSYQTSLLASSNELAPYNNYRNEIGNLKYTTEEIQNASSFFGGKTYAGSEATESLFKRDAGKYQILHLAMHAIIDEENPLQSKLIFTQNNDTLEDGFLNAYELYNMDLTAEMAVLSACNTGYGKLARGEGVLSLGRAFAYAGCPSIVLSLWPAQDQATADIMTYFYEGLSKGYTKDQAMREAKLQYLESASDFFTHPFYWASFVVQGDAAPIKLSTGISMYWLLLALSIFVVGVAYLIRKKNSGKSNAG